MSEDVSISRVCMECVTLDGHADFCGKLHAAKAALFDELLGVAESLLQHAEAEHQFYGPTAISHASKIIEQARKIAKDKP